MARLFSDPPVVPRRTPEERRALRIASGEPVAAELASSWAQILGLLAMLLVVLFLTMR